MLSTRRFIFGLMTTGLFLVVFCGASHAQRDSRKDGLKPASSPGKQTFASNCAGCHGLDGKGSERAPNIAAGSKVQRLNDSGVSRIISDGIPGTGMPAFHSLSLAQVHGLVSYLRTLQGSIAGRSLPGDAKRGKEIFFGKGECSSCHSLAGEGGFLGPDLSAYGATRPADAIMSAIVNKSRIVPGGYKSAAATTRDGTRVEGVVRNEDNFSVQLQATDGQFHFFQKSDLQELKYLDHSLMPANYGERLSRDELNDLVSYLMTAGSPARAEPASRPK